MRLWLSHTGEVSLREQLATQVVLGILCQELQPGERLPSTRELARRFGIHANTASAAFRQLEKEGWVEFRHGSGVFVRATRPDTAQTPELAPGLVIDRLIGELMAKARQMGAAQSLVTERLRRWLALKPATRWLLVEPDPELRRIVLHELAAALTLPVAGCGPEECGETGTLEGARVVVLPSKANAVRKLLPPGTELAVLQVHPVGPALGEYLPLPEGVLVGIVSRWKDFLRIAQTMLIAAGCAPQSLLVKDATHAGWPRGLPATAAVVCDSSLEEKLPRECRPIVFRLLAENSLQTLREMEASSSGIDLSNTKAF
jgi:GntR family transcriptional regulator